MKEGIKEAPDTKRREKKKKGEKKP